MMHSNEQLVGIRYIGLRPMYRDVACGSGLTFEKDEVKFVPSSIARKMLQHASVYVVAADSIPSKSQVAQVPVAQKTKEEIDRADVQEAEIQISLMDTKEALEQFAKDNFSMKIDKRMGIDALRGIVTGYLHQYGLRG